MRTFPDARFIRRRKQDDYAFLSDMFPTGWHCTRLAGLQAWESIAIYGAGPVDLMAALSAMIQGASEIMVVDRHPDRLALAGKIGCIPIDDSNASPVDQVLEQTRGEGADRGCECVGYQCHEPHGREVPNLTMNNLVNSVRFTRGTGVGGIFLPKDHSAADQLAKDGEIACDMASSGSRAAYWNRPSQHQPLQNRHLRDLHHAGRAKLSWIIWRRLDEAPNAYKHFDARDKGWTKVVLRPAV